MQVLYISIIIVRITLRHETMSIVEMETVWGKDYYQDRYSEILHNRYRPFIIDIINADILR